MAPNKKVSLSFEALKPGIDFSSAMEILDGIFLQCFIYIENLLIRVATLIILARHCTFIL